MCADNQSGSKGMVLIFSASFTLIAITTSMLRAAKLTGSYYSSVKMVVAGKLKTTNNLYFRLVPDDVEVSLADLNTLSLQEFDELCGLQRDYCNPKLVNRRRKKFNKKS